MNNRSWVENMIWSVVALNFIVLMYVFLIPRLQFMATHWRMESESLMETSGAGDIPNQYIKAYKIANQIRKFVRNDSIVLMPPDNEKFDLNRSVLIQRLYPWKIYFSGDKGFDEFVLSLENQEKKIYIMFNENWGKIFCKEESVESLGKSGFGVCQGSLTQLTNSL
jgi:hypothetical protein